MSVPRLPVKMEPHVWMGSIGTTVSVAVNGRELHAKVTTLNNMPFTHSHFYTVFVCLAIEYFGVKLKVVVVIYFISILPDDNALSFEYSLPPLGNSISSLGNF